ncbi:hypothetical protein HY967_00450, partial [Candidatus Jorgensenbacteria bacterium]|nr:hypothetical protein [Candidatus Jorgensenbacteria bacterium]
MINSIEIFTEQGRFPYEIAKKLKQSVNDWIAKNSKKLHVNEIDCEFRVVEAFAGDPPEFVMVVFIKYT